MHVVPTFQRILGNPKYIYCGKEYRHEGPFRKNETGFDVVVVALGRRYINGADAIADTIGTQSP